jgi:hypothetical protein
MQTNALYATFTHNLGLSSRELAEIGGFSDKFARDLLAGKRPFPPDVVEALHLLQDDIDVLTDGIVEDIHEGQGAIWMYRTNADLRRHTNIPGRGKAEGGFVGPYRIAALTARDALSDAGIDTVILFFDELS